MKTKISIEDVYEIDEEMREINQIPLDEIEWTFNGEVVDVDSQIVSEFEFTGLTNMDFILSGYCEKSS